MKKFISNNWHLLALALVFGWFSVMSWHYGEEAKDKFWWKLWDVVGVVSIVGFISVVYYVYNKHKQAEKRGY